jgi:cytochrome bd-I ubiquinol oxidase subunit X
MWYFSWILGIGLACAFAILNAMWLELYEGAPAAEDAADDAEHPR